MKSNAPQELEDVVFKTLDFFYNLFHPRQYFRQRRKTRQDPEYQNLALPD